MDNFAAESVRFNNFFVSPVCAPTRSSLMTGRYSLRTGVRDTYNGGAIMASSEVTLAEMLKQANFTTGIFGKWHLGALPHDPKLSHPQPGQQGFDYSFGTEMNARPPHLNPNNFVRNGKPVGVIEGYACQIVAKEGIEWLSRRNEKDPFFAYFAFHEPHSVVASPKELVDKYPDMPKKDAEYLANIDHLDMAIGKILDYLSVNNLIENTIIIF